MLNKKIIDLLNKQINLEFYSSNLYKQMGAWCENKGYTGCAAFLGFHAGEESVHMEKLFRYVSECGALPVLGSIAAPPTEYSDVASVFKATLEHEHAITASINALVAAAFEEKDFSTFQFLQWYVSEQHEEEHLFQGILDKMNIIGVEGKGIYFFDKEIRKMGKVES
jgi:ferritin